MSITERSQARRSTIRLPAFSEITLLLVIAVGFLALHILTAALLMPAAKDDPATPRQETRALTD